jgi:hypothetical protein
MYWLLRSFPCTFQHHTQYTFGPPVQSIQQRKGMPCLLYFQLLKTSSLDKMYIRPRLSPVCIFRSRIICRRQHRWHQSLQQDTHMLKYRLPLSLKTTWERYMLYRQPTQTRSYTILLHTAGNSSPHHNNQRRIDKNLHWYYPTTPSRRNLNTACKRHYRADLSMFPVGMRYTHR